ncbi:hypothetical protein [Streptomyces fuscichromogenes]|uniref:Uncharacterized protein n=1 Tax=Streptomyces fuscichromogenes TaxID=1324013 RepID=A0A917XB31_9ACTN|nr:hypothetical protein [Streptomyces fuscichromogenes]GGN02424.1 hypothetical protein GCM10011578_024820 [Streptomyces fuscichromogenes]
MYSCEGCGRPRRGLFFGSGIGEAKWWCWRCQSTDRKELISSLDDHAQGVLNRDADGVHWPYGPNIYVQMRADMLDWADRHDLKSGDTGSSSGLHWDSISEYPSLTAEVGPESWYGAGTSGVYIWNEGNRSVAVRPPR